MPWCVACGPGTSFMIATTGGIGFESGWGTGAGGGVIWRCPKGGVPEVEDPAVLAREPYPLPSGVGVIDTIGSFRRGSLHPRTAASP